MQYYCSTIAQILRYSADFCLICPTSATTKTDTK
nr:MAG TPA: hypothetical protein [Caudoviricetes sp.]